MNGTLGWDEDHSIGSTWMLIRNTNFCPILDLLNIGGSVVGAQESSTKHSRFFLCVLLFKNCYSAEHIVSTM